MLIRCYKTRFFLWNTTNTDKNDVNKQDTHTHTPNTQREREIALGMVSIKINDTPLLPFLKQPHLFYQPFHFYGKNNLNPPFFENLENSNLGGSNYAFSS